MTRLSSWLPSRRSLSLRSRLFHGAIVVLGATLVLGARLPEWSPAARLGTIHADARHGDDAAGAGTAEAPFRTITRALVAAGEGGRPGGARIRVRLGTYDAALGERFPLRVPPGVIVEGHGSGVTILEGGEAESLLEVGGTSGRVVLAALGLRGKGDGIRIDASPADSKSHAGLDVVVQDVGAEVEGSGIVVGPGRDAAGVRPAAPPLRVFLRGSWFQGCREGLRVRGLEPAALDLEDCVFEACGVGASLAGPPDAAPALRARRCRFVRCREAGIRRTVVPGMAAAAGGTADLVEDCLFLGNDIGVDLPSPGGDAPLILRRGVFLRNTHYGLHAVGAHGDPARSSIVEDCRFRWNGVGLHVVNVQVRFVLRRSRIADNLGSGIFYANFIAEPGEARFTDCLVANNGAVGIHCLADNRVLGARIERCTIVGNDTSGIERKERHGGKGRFRIRGCIVAGNGTDLVRIHEDEVSETFVGDGSLPGGREGAGDLTGDPGFVDVAARDYHLRADSPCLDRIDPASWPEPEKGEGVGPGETPAVGPRDAGGRPRAVGLVDLGCFERPRGS